MSTANEFLTKAGKLMEERGNTNGYDSKKERSFSSTAKAFNAITGKNITPAEVCLILQIVKDVRQWAQPRLHLDSVEDSIAYAALKAEELVKQYEE